MKCFGGKKEKRQVVTKCQQHELYKENIRLKDQIHDLKGKESADVIDGIENPTTIQYSNYENFKIWKRYAKLVLLGIFIVAVVFIAYFIWSGLTLNDRKNVKVDQSAYHMHLSAGASDIRQCRKESLASTDLRKTFPDIDYAMLGYDIIKGYPDSNSHDPGFTYPIFMADYSNVRLTSDCRYSVPRGFIVIPDVSCVTSFISTIIRNSLELQKSLSVSVEASGGYLGFSFSASSSYKTTSSQVSTGEKVFITSSAKCSYYFSEVDTTQPPPLNPGFIDWAKRLQRSASDEALVEFVKHYGTHFTTGIVFGARYIKQHSMTTETFKSASSRDVSVAIQASYSGIASASGSFSLDSKQREAASKFSQDVETTTISVGAAPPSNGDALYWAATVKENPVPISYKLKPIADLFTPKYMRGTGINYNMIRRKLKGIEKKYCQQLLEEGSVNTCDDAIPIGLRINNHILHNAAHPLTLKVSESSCISKCFDDQFCLSVAYVPDDSTCSFHDGVTELRPMTGSGKNTPRAIIFPSRVDDLKKDLKVLHLEIGDKARDGSKSVDDPKACREACIKDSACDVFSFSADVTRSDNCKLYASKSVSNLQFSPYNGMATYFVHREAAGNSTTNAYR